MGETFYTLNKKLMQIPKEIVVKIKVNESWYNQQREQNIMITNSNNKTGIRRFQGREIVFDNSISDYEIVFEDEISTLTTV